MFHCRACSGETTGKEFVAREMFFGTKKQFEYVECAECGSVQIAEVPPPEILAEHYPADYYSIQPSPTERNQGLRRLLALVRTRHIFDKPNLLGPILAKLWPLPTTGIVDLLSRTGVKWQNGILDVGCGSGALLDGLASLGFRNLLGVDPFVEREVVTPNGVTILKTELKDVPGEFGVISFIILSSMFLIRLTH